MAFKIACFLAMYFVVCAAATSEPEPETYTTSLEPEPPSETGTTSTQPTGKPEESGSGECKGNDSRCAGSSADACKRLERDGVDCRWVKGEGGSTSQMSNGECAGNDSRCAKSKHAKCTRLSNQGADCTWEGTFNAQSSSGTCAGNDSRCPGKSEQACTRLTREGSDCVWRESFSAVGNFTLSVSNADDFVNDTNATEAVQEGLANVTGVLKENVELDVHAVTNNRRLEGRQLVNTASSVVITYVINVGVDAPPSIVATSDVISQVMTSSNKDIISAAITSKVQEAVGTNSYGIVVQDVPGIAVVVFSAPTGNATNDNMTTTSDGSLLEDSGALILAAHPLFALLGFGFYLF